MLTDDDDAGASTLLATYYCQVVETAAFYAEHAGRVQIHSADMNRANNYIQVAWADQVRVAALVVPNLGSAVGAPTDMPFVRSDAAWTPSACTCAKCAGINRAAPPPPIADFELAPILWSATRDHVAELRGHRPAGSRAIMLDSHRASGPKRRPISKFSK